MISFKSQIARFFAQRRTISSGTLNALSEWLFHILYFSQGLFTTQY